MNHIDHIKQKQPVVALLVGAGLAICSAGVAAQSLETVASVGVSNLDYNGSNNILALLDDTRSGDAAEVNLSAMTFTGLNGSGSVDTLSFAGGAKAFIVVPGQRAGLHVAAHGSLLNTFYNSNNPPYFDATVEPVIVDENGTPDNFYAYGKAQIVERLSYGGLGAGQYYARSIFRVHGHVQGDGFDSAYIVFQVGSNPLEFGVFEPNLANGEYVGDYATQRYPVVNGMPTDQKTAFYVWYEADTQSVDEGSNISGVFDFSETITLDHIEVVDENNNPVSGWTVTTDSGLDYDLPIFRSDFDSPPEPAAIAEQAIAPNAVDLCVRLQDVQQHRTVALQRTSFCDQPIGAIREIKFRKVEASVTPATD